MKTVTPTKPARKRAATVATAAHQVATIATPAPVAQPMESSAMQMLRAAVARGATIEELDRLISLKERMEATEAKQAFTAAMIEFKRSAPTVERNRTGTVNPRDTTKAGYTYRYADLAAVCDKVIAGLAAVDITHDWTHGQSEGLLQVTCTLTHRLGHSKSTTLMAGPDTSGGKNAIQGIGSANSYLERYTLLGISGIAVASAEDDDGAGTGVTAGDREEMRQAASNMRRDRQSPHQVAGSRNQSTAAPKALLDEARAKADRGHKEFGVYWRELAEADRGKLMSEMNDLSERANAATAHQDAS